MLSDGDIKALMRKLAEGNASQEELGLLQRQAQEDPFLREALDGYNLFGGDHRENLNEVESLLRRRSSRTNADRKPNVARWQIAAAVTMLVAVGGWMIKGSLNKGSSSPATEQTAFFSDDENLTSSEPGQIALSEPGELSENEESTEKKENSPAFSDSQVSAVENQSEAIVALSQPTTSAGADSPVKSRPQDETNTAPAASAANQVADQVTETDAGVVQNFSRSKIIAESSGDVPAAASIAPEGQGPNDKVLLEGRVVDETGEPLIGAKIKSLKAKTDQISDLEGHFKIKQDELEEGIEVSYIGFQAKEIKSQRADDIEKIVLQEDDITLDEVVVINSRQAKEQTQQRNSELTDASQPKGGWEKYQAYILQNIKKPATAIKSNIKGVVKLSFFIGKNNRPTDIQVESSLGYGCDEEAIRLVENGPKWEVGNAEERVTLEIKF